MISSKKKYEGMSLSTTYYKYYPSILTDAIKNCKKIWMIFLSCSYYIFLRIIEGVTF